MRPLISFLIAINLLLGVSPASALDARALVEKAVELIDRGQPSLARAYLEPALIAPFLHATERSRAYYLRGYSFFDERLYVSARLDYNRALEFNADNPGALVALGRLHLEGLGTSQNPGLAFLLFTKAAALGHRDGKVMAGRALLFGEGVERDVPAARRWLIDAAGAGDASAMLHMGLSHRAPYAPKPNVAKARAWYEKAHAAGSPDALLALGHMHANGEFGTADPVRAFALFLQAAEAGFPGGQVRVAHAYLHGLGVPKDVQEARKWFDRAARQGSKEAWVGLGFLYEAGEGVPADPGKASQWYRKAALAGDRQGIGRYVQLLLKLGDLASHREAASWLGRLARKGQIRAANDYAWLLATSPYAEVRDARLAVHFARMTVEDASVPARLDTLAAAYAEAGRFGEAVATQQQALALEDPDVIPFRSEMERRLAAYKAGTPWRE